MTSKSAFAEAELLKRVEAFLEGKFRNEIKDWDSKLYNNKRYKRLRSVLSDFKQGCPRLYLFGGLLRDLSAGLNPRDIDLVTNEASLLHLNPFVQNWEPRHNKFGGLNFKREGWEFDLWPVEQTWAFNSNCDEIELDQSSFASLPYTTFLNVEAIVVELWPETGERQVHEHKFFEAFHNRVVEINYEPNPSPAHCVIRSLLVAQRLNFSLGPKLVRYINDNIDSISSREFAMLQSSHYGRIVLGEENFDRLTRLIKSYCRRNSDNPLDLPHGRQLSIFEGAQIHFNF
jgi:hypothetical protein